MSYFKQLEEKSESAKGRYYNEIDDDLSVTDAKMSELIDKIKEDPNNNALAQKWNETIDKFSELLEKMSKINQCMRIDIIINQED